METSKGSVYTAHDDFCISFHFDKDDKLNMFMINSVDPEEITSRHHETINGSKGIRRGKIFSDFNEIKTHIKKIIKKDIVIDTKGLVSCIKEIECLFKKM